MYRIVQRKKLANQIYLMVVHAPRAVSYTHLDVYKRQA